MPNHINKKIKCHKIKINIFSRKSQEKLIGANID